MLQRFLTWAVVFAALASSATAHAFTITRVSGSVLYRDGGDGLVGAYEGYALTNDDGVDYDDLWVRAEDFDVGAAIQLAASEDGLHHVGPLADGATKMAFFYLVSDGTGAALEHTIRVYDSSALTTSIASLPVALSAEEASADGGNQVETVTHTPSDPGVGNTLVITVSGETGTLGGAQQLAFTPASDAGWRADAFQLESTEITLTAIDLDGNDVVETNQLAFDVPNTGNSGYVAEYTFRIIGVTDDSTPVTPIAYVESDAEVTHNAIDTAIPPIESVPLRLRLTRTPSAVDVPDSGGTVTFGIRVVSADPNPVVIDRFVETLVASTGTIVPGSSTIDSVPIGDPTVAGDTWTWSGPFVLSPGSAIVLGFQVSYAAASGTHLQQGAAFVGATQIDRTRDSGDDEPLEAIVFVGDSPDSDTDSLSDALELTLGTDPEDDDTDGDSYADGAEVSTFGTDPVDADSDDDGLHDADESSRFTDPMEYDVDLDGLPDGLEVGVQSPIAAGTSDGTGVAFGGTDLSAGQYTTDSDPNSTTEPNDPDSDGDFLSDGEEDANRNGATVFTLGATGTSGSGETDPMDSDTDDDGLSDAEEVNGSSPLSAPTDPLDTDTDDGGSSDLDEAIIYDTDPLDSADDVVCGNGVVNDQHGEQCDDSGTSGGDGCSITCTIEDGYQCPGEPSQCTPVCGDGAIVGDEPCDDGDTDDSDGCSASCAVEHGFSCGGAPSTCTSSCGDGLRASDEDCDDGGTADGDGCSASCAVEPAFECSGEPSSCSSSCGDGLIASDEYCDDGGAAAGDGCSDSCAVEPGFDCTGAPSQCTAICGDSMVLGDEECDDGGTDDADGCDAGCLIEPGFVCTGEPSSCNMTCGNGLIDSGEQCDDGDVDNDDGCNDNCAVEHGFGCSGAPSSCASSCGDGERASDEACDDGGSQNGDGCSGVCEVEPGYACSGEPSACSTSCGDGIVAGTEACDDDNNVNGDGCSATCTIEEEEQEEDRDSDGVTDADDNCPDHANPTQADFDADDVGDRCDADRDGDDLDDGLELAVGSDVGDRDSDDDGVLDGDEPDPDADGDEDGDPNVLDADSDDDGLFDGTELGLVSADLDDDTDLSADRFESDADPVTTTDPQAADSDGGGECDGAIAVADVCSAGEDENENGRVDDGERDPNDEEDDVQAAAPDAGPDPDPDPDAGPDSDPDAGPDSDPDPDRDTDGDGLSDEDEEALGTDPDEEDSDGDGLSDATEVNVTHTDPLSRDQVQGGSAFDCSATPGTRRPSSASWMLCLLFAFFVRRRLTRQATSSLLIIAALASWLLWAPHARAQGFDAQRWKPAPNQQDNLFTVRTVRSLPSGQVELGIVGNYANDPLVLSDENDRRSLSLIADQITGDVLLSVGILDRWELGVDLPVVLLQKGDDGAAPALIDDANPGVGVGDLHLATKLMLFNVDALKDPGGAGLALIVDGFLPTGDGGKLQGEKVRVAPGLVFDYAFGKALRLSLEATYRVRSPSRLLETEIDDAIGVGIGFDIPLDHHRRAHILVEGSSEIAVEKPEQGQRDMPVEAMGGMRYMADSGFMIEGGFGAGLHHGVAAPDYRAMLGLAMRLGQDWDTDRDGYRNDDDGCPEAAEDRDGYQDLDGCPDLDNDRDQVADKADRCPLDPEDKDGFQDSDGCPEADNDRDGLLDGKDDCPTDAEDKDDFQDTDGCPERDNDHDGIEDGSDECPIDAEDKDGYQDDNGCPDPDNDRDEILDADDKCPNEAEDIDAFEDKDGCPEAGSGQVRLTCEKIVIADKVYFGSNSDRILPRSFPLLDQVASVLSEAPYIKRLRVEGHTDNRGSDRHNLKLSDRRAASVMRYLVSKGIDQGRLQSQGFGETQPIANNKKPAGRAENRRVEFIITERDRACR